MFTRIIRWCIRKIGIEAEIKKETKAKIGREIVEVVAWVSTASGNLIRYKNPELKMILTTIAGCLERNAYHISADMVRKVALSHLHEREEKTIDILFLLHQEEVDLEDFIAFLDMSRYQLQEIINSHDGQPNEEDHKRTIKHILKQREWQFPYFPADIRGYKPENYE